MCCPKYYYCTSSGGAHPVTAHHPPCHSIPVLPHFHCPPPSSVDRAAVNLRLVPCLSLSNSLVILTPFALASSQHHFLLTAPSNLPNPPSVCVNTNCLSGPPRHCIPSPKSVRRTTLLQFAQVDCIPTSTRLVLAFVLPTRPLADICPFPSLTICCASMPAV